MHAVHARPAPHVPWLDRLPPTFDCTLSWSAEELEWLQTSPTRRRAEGLQQWAAEAWERIFDSASAPPAFDATRERFDWALCAVWSRSF
eukprot:2136121-Prymnesium_polylepis.1